MEAEVLAKSKEVFTFFYQNLGGEIYDKDHSDLQIDLQDYTSSLLTR